MISHINKHILIVGPQRTATSWLDKNLRELNYFNLPKDVKETFYFENHIGRYSYTNYLKLFNDFGKNIYIDVAPTLFNSLFLIEEINNFLENVSVIVIYREPVEKAWSLYLHEVAKGRLGGDFFDDLNEFSKGLESGLYFRNITYWKKHFDNVVLLSQYELDNEPSRFITSLATTLNVDKSFLIENFDLKKYGVAMFPKYKYLAKFFASFASLLRRNNLHLIVNIGKIMGLKSVFTGGNSQSRVIPENVRNYLEEYYKKDTQLLKSEFKIYHED